MFRNASRVVVALTALLVVVGSAAAQDAADVNRLAEFAPADCILFVGYDGRNAAFEGTALHDILNEPEVKEFFEGPLAALKELVRAEVAGDADVDVLGTLLGTRIGFALLPPPGAMAPPDFLLIIQEDGPEGDAAKVGPMLVERFFPFGPEAFEPAEVAGVEARVLTMGGRESHAYAHVRGHFVFGTFGAFQKAVDAQAAKVTATDELQRFRELAAGDALLLVHYRHAAFMGAFGPMVFQGRAAELMQDPEFGLANLRAVSLAVTPEGRALRTSVFVDAPGELKGLLEFLAGRPLDPDIVRLAPEATDSFWAFSLDPGELWDFVVRFAAPTPEERAKLDRSLARTNEQLGLDLRNDFIGGLGDEFAVFTPGFGVVVRLKDPAKFRRSLEVLLAKLVEEMAEADVELHVGTMEYHGRTIYYLDGSGFPLMVQPAYVLVGDYAVFGLYPMTVKAYVLAMEEERDLTDNPDFQAARSKAGRAPSALGYSDTRKAVAAVWDWIPWVVGMASMAPEEVRPFLPDPAKLPPSAIVTRRLFPSVGEVRRVDGGILLSAHSPLGLPPGPAFEPGAGMGMAQAAILAGMVTPALFTVRAEARKVADKSNLHQIAKGACVWLSRYGDNRFFPPSLEALAESGLIIDPRVFIRPDSGTMLVEGEFVTDYECILDLVQGKVPELDVDLDVPLAWDKEPFRDGGRNVVFFDSHVEWVDEEAFETWFTNKVEEWLEGQDLSEKGKAWLEQRKQTEGAADEDLTLEDRQLADKSNLNQIGKAAFVWMARYGDNEFYPPSLEALVDGRIIEDPRVFLRPGSGTARVEGEFVTDYECILDFVEGKAPEPARRADVPLAWDKEPFEDGGRNVVFFDSHVEWADEDRFEEFMGRAEAWLAEQDLSEKGKAWLGERKQRERSHLERLDESTKEYESALDFVKEEVPEEEVARDVPLTWVKEPFEDGDRYVVFFGAAVEWADEERFEELMAEVEAWLQEQDLSEKGKAWLDERKKREGAAEEPETNE